MSFQLTFMFCNSKMNSAEFQNITVKFLDLRVTLSIIKFRKLTFSTKAAKPNTSDQLLQSFKNLWFCTEKYAKRKTLIQKLTLSSWPWPAVAVCSWPTSVAWTEIHQQGCLHVPASICLCLPVSLTNALCLYQRYQLWTKNIRCCCVTEKVKVSFEASCNLRSKACCAVWSVHKQATVNGTWWGIWHVFDTTTHRPCKCLQYSWSTNSTTTLDMCWQFVILNGYIDLCSGSEKRVYLIIYQFIYLGLTSTTYNMRHFFFFLTL